MSLQDVLLILEHYKYIAIFPIMIVEGPIITIISGFLVYLGFLNVFIAYPILVVGDLIGDSIYYGIGKYGKQFEWAQRLERWLGYDEKSEEFIKNHFKQHTIKTLLLAKVSHGFGMPVQITAGMAGVDFYKYLYIETVATIPKTLILLIIGFYLGSSYVKIDEYLNLWASIIVGLIILIVLYLIFNKSFKKFLV